MEPTPMRVLILGGTTEASALARELAGDSRIEVTLSLAGLTANPASTPGVTVRSGGFGGVDGLTRWLTESRSEAVIDATHPFAARISANAMAAIDTLGLPSCTVVRPPWTAADNDRWQHAATMEDAAGMLGGEPRSVFLSVGRQSVGAFRRSDQHAYVIRAIEKPDAEDMPPHVTLIQARGPFALADEIDILLRHAIEVVVTKNAGGNATYAKIVAARELGLPVIMIERPEKPGRNIVSTSADALRWLETLHTKSRSERGV
jgi:precorrin-6A/cobalt-precorrin-6A reductase